MDFPTYKNRCRKSYRSQALEYHAFIIIVGQQFDYRSDFENSLRTSSMCIPLTAPYFSLTVTSGLSCAKKSIYFSKRFLKIADN